MTCAGMFGKSKAVNEKFVCNQCSSFVGYSLIQVTLTLLICSCVILDGHAASMRPDIAAAVIALS